MATCSQCYEKSEDTLICPYCGKPVVESGREGEVLIKLGLLILVIAVIAVLVLHAL